MSIFTRFQDWMLTHSIKRQFRYPSLAEANKALLAVEEEVVDFQQINYQMNQYKRVLTVPETERDLAYIPVYLSIERYVLDHRPPSVKRMLTKEQLRDKVRQAVKLDVIKEPFRLIFLPQHEQADHLLKLGIIGVLRFLMTSLGKAQLDALIKLAAGATPLSMIKVGDDGINFDDVHSRMSSLPLDAVLAAYQEFYKQIFAQIITIFGRQAAVSQVLPIRKQIEHTYDNDLVTIYVQTLPEEVKPAGEVY